MLSYVTVGILPSDRFNGGLIANIPVWLGDNDIHHKVLQVVTADSTYYQANPDQFMLLTESAYYLGASEANQAAMREQGLYISANPVTIDSSNAAYQNFTNGMFNSEGDAVKNGIDQTGSTIFTLNYNPTHGFLPDLFESLIDKSGGTTGVARQTGEFIYDVTTARGTSGSNFAAHSQGNLLMQSGIENRMDNGGFQDRNYFVDQSKAIQEERDRGIPTFSSFGSPVNTQDMRDTIENESGLNYIYNGAYTKENDAVGESLGGNQGQNAQMPLVDRLRGLSNVIDLLREDSPHSTYLCGDHQGASHNCGYKP